MTDKQLRYINRLTVFVRKLLKLVPQERREELENEFDLDELVNTLKNAPGIVVQDDIQNNIYPLAINANGHDDVFVGRIRRDFSVKSGVNLWVVADNLRKGAASNAVQILEKLI